MKFFGKKKLTEQEQLYLDIVQKMVDRQDSLIEINPDSMDYLVSLEKEQYFLFVDSIGIQLSNHGFILPRRFEDYVVSKAKDIIKTEATKRREAKKQAIFANENNLLIKIKDSL